jgi:hypothetical protein
MKLTSDIIEWCALCAGIITWLWITAVAFIEGEILWGVGCLIIPGVCIVYALVRFDKLKIPLFLLLGAWFSRIAIWAIKIGTS